MMSHSHLLARFRNGPPPENCGPICPSIFMTGCRLSAANTWNYEQNGQRVKQPMGPSKFANITLSTHKRPRSSAIPLPKSEGSGNLCQIVF